LSFSAIDEAHFKVRVYSQLGEGNADSKLPFFETGDRWRTTLLKALGADEFRPSAFAQETEQEWMVQQGWLSNNCQSFHSMMLARIGQAMYRSLFPVGGVRDVLQKMIARAEDNKTQLHIRLEFDAEMAQGSRLHEYPWEIAHDGRKFLAHHQVCFSRYIAHSATVAKLPPVEQLKVLLIASGASDEENGLPALSKKEQKAVLRGLERAQAEGHVQVKVLEPASLNQLRFYLTEQQSQQAPHIIHFDGHGCFGKRCNIVSCHTIHKDSRAETCKGCGVSLPPEPQGYLLFETEEDEADYVSATELGILLQKTSFRDQPTQQSGLMVAVLSACKSGMALGGESAFNGVAQRLISHQIPAVVAMQYNVRVDSATRFSEQFYLSLGRKDSVATAISHGQEAIGTEGNQWYRPILYLRWQSNEGGQLFVEHLDSHSQSHLLQNPEDFFGGLIQWISMRTPFLEDLDLCYEDKIFSILRRAESKQRGFTEEEIEVLYLLMAYYQFCNGRNSRVKQFKYARKEDFLKYLQGMIGTRKSIRRSQVTLSSLIKNKEISSLLEILENQYGS
jgi:CHAT domain-containing protein